MTTSDSMTLGGIARYEVTSTAACVACRVKIQESLR